TYVRRGAVKASGTRFGKMSNKERAVWDDRVEHSYRQFERVVEEGRPHLKGKLEENVIDEPRTLLVEEADPETKISKMTEVKIGYVRQRADGGIFTAGKAAEVGLAGEIG